MEPGAHREIIHFFEKEESRIQKLEFTEYFELLVAYVEALFEVGQHRKHLLMVDRVIEESIAHNVHDFKGQDIFRQMLFRRAASLYHTRQYHEADYVLREMIRINPRDEDASRLMQRCRLRLRPALGRNTKAAAILIFLFTAILIAGELLLVRPFYPMYVAEIEQLRIGLFVFGCLMLVGGEVFHRLWCRWEVHHFVQEVFRDKHF